MFDENFSFFSSATTPFDTITDISPFASRSPSPGPQYQPTTTTTHPIPARRDSRFDTHRSASHHTTRQPSITTLTTSLQHHHLSPTTFTPETSSSPPSPTSTSTSTQDEGFFDGPDTPSSQSSYPSSPEPYHLWDEDLAMTDLHHQSHATHRPSLSLEAQALSSYTMRRRQRQALVRLQCLAKRAPDLAMLLEECHPSSLPLGADWAVPTARSGSTSSPSGCRVEKERGGSASGGVRKVSKIRKRVTR